VQYNEERTVGSPETLPIDDGQLTPNGRDSGDLTALRPHRAPLLGKNHLY